MTYAPSPTRATPAMSGRRKRALSRSGLAAVLGAMSVVSLAGPALASASPDPRVTPGGAQVRVDHSAVVNRNVAYSFAQDIAANPVPAHPRAATRDYVQLFSSVSALRAGKFTVTQGGDQACVDWSAGAGGDATATAGPCRPGDRLGSRAPLVESAHRLRDWIAAQPGVADGKEWTLMQTGLLRKGDVLAMVAPAGVRITGVTDVDGNGMDDDARVAFRARGKVVCAQVPRTTGEQFRLFYTGCRHLPARHVPAPDQTS